MDIKIIVFITYLGNILNVTYMHCGSGCISCTVIDCQDVLNLGFSESGVYHVVPKGTFTGYDVYCDMQTDGGGWLVFQRRKDGSVDFFRTWTDYVIGFGDIRGEHWLGNAALHAITSQGFYEMRVDLEDWEGYKAYAQYKVFQVAGMKELYNLTIAGYFGDAGDSMSFHNGYIFSTKDREYGMSRKNLTCASAFYGGWWYMHYGCHYANINGLYFQHGQLNESDVGKGIIWNHWDGRGKYRYSLKFTEMKLRRV